MGKSIERQATVSSRWYALLLALLFFQLATLPANGALGRKKYSLKGPIKTVVILVMENRSFDHMLGWLKRLNPEIDGLSGNESNPISVDDPDSIKVPVSDDSEFIDADPGHSFQAIREQIFGTNDTSATVAPMNGFAQQAEGMLEGLSKTVMSGFRPEVVPVYTALAMEFAVFDRWFASVPASTQPNRLYIHSATSYGATSNAKPELIQGFPQKTIFDSVHEAGLSFGIYYQNIPATLFLRNLRKLKYISKFHQYSVSFKVHAKLGLLPNLAVIEQRYFDLEALPANDDHPSHDVSEGQKLVKEIYETLRASPQWNEMLFVITYDEHGGFFDHVPTPLQNVPSPDDRMGADPFYFEFDRLGVRVPTIMISPWINKGTVVHEPDGPSPDSHYEHSSLPATIRKIFELDLGFLTKRDAWAGTFEHILYERSTPRTDCPEDLPSPPWSLRHSRARENARLSEFQEELVQLASQLNGNHLLNSYPNIGKSMNIKQANAYVEEAVAGFLKEGRRQLENGLNDSDLVYMEPSVISRGVGPLVFAFSEYS